MQAGRNVRSHRTMNLPADIDFEFPLITPDSFDDWQQQSRLLDRLQIGFICGPQRSGTTWMVRLLQNHPQAVCRSEGHAMSAHCALLIEAIRQANQIFPEHSPFCRIADRDIAMLCRQVIDRQLLNYISSDSAKSLNTLRAVLDKTPRHTRCINELAALYPSSKFILCTRDPRDAGVSWWKLLVRSQEPKCSFEEGMLYYAEHVWGPGIRDARAAGDRLGPSRFIEMEFERRLEDAEGETRRVLEFLGLSTEPEALRLCVEAGELSNHSEDWLAKVNPERAAHSDSRYQRGTTGNWRRFFSEEFGDEVLRRATETSAAPATA